MNAAQITCLAATLLVLAWIWYEATHPMVDPENSPDGSYPKDEGG